MQRIHYDDDDDSIIENTLESIDLLYLHKYFYGGVTTFTAHLFYKMGLDKMNNKPILHFSKKNEKKLRDFGYDIKYKNITLDHLLEKKDLLITVIKDNFFQVISELEEKKTSSKKNKFLVIHDPRDISNRMIPYLKKWNLITIRKTIQDYLKLRYDLHSTFIYHPFYPYPTFKQSNTTDKNGAVSISRIGYGKNIDILINANKKLDKKKFIDIYGCITPKYVYLTFGKNNPDFKNSYHGKFKKSFFTISKLLSKYKFVVDLSIIRYDGGGTQYTFLEAIHDGCALILHRKWIENVYRYYKKDYCDFKEGYNCFAVDNSDELVDLIKKDPDTTKIVQNSKNLLERHTKVDWLSSILKNIT